MTIIPSPFPCVGRPVSIICVNQLFVNVFFANIKISAWASTKALRYTRIPKSAGIYEIESRWQVSYG
jgi:hypothetical protein